MTDERMAEISLNLEQDIIRDKYRGALLGLAAGDTLGTTVEFRSPGTFRPVTDMIGGGPFSLKPGEWTDVVCRLTSRTFDMPHCTALCSSQWSAFAFLEVAGFEAFNFDY
jgi:hypothetical protein